MWRELKGKSVALVGNSTTGLTRPLGAAIDAHGVVIRMNAGAPTEAHHWAIGERTDVLSVGTIRCLEASMAELSEDTPIWFYKATNLGDREWKVLEDSGKYTHIWRYPCDWIAEANKRLDGRASQGIGLIVDLVEHIEAESVSVFNVDFFGVLGACESWWHGERPEAIMSKHRPHSGVKEFALFEELGFTRKEPGWWTWTRSTTK